MRTLRIALGLVLCVVLATGCGSADEGAPPGPTVTGVTPDLGPAAGGTPITITGTNFTPDTVATLTDAPVEGLTFVDAQTLTGMSPQAAGGTEAGILVSNANGLAFVLAAFYYIPEPKIIGLSPNSGPPPGGTPVTITGSGFADFDAGPNTVTIGGETPTDVVTVSDSTIECTLPPGNGPATVIVTNANGSGMKRSGYRYFPPPTVSIVTPAMGTPLGGTPVTITGTGFTANAPGSNDVSFGGSPAANVMTVNDSTITCETPPRNGLSDVSVTNANGVGTATDGYFFYPPPTLTAVSPDTGSAAGGVTVTLTGSGFLDNDAGTPTVTIDGTDATNVTVKSDTEIECDTPASGVGDVDIEVSNANGKATLSDQYEALLHALIGSAGNTLYIVDTTDGSTTTIGGIGFTPTALAVAPDNTCYATTTSGDLITIDLSSGAGTTVAALSPSTTVTELTFKGTRLIGVDRSSGGKTFEINTSTAGVTALTGTFARTLYYGGGGANGGPFKNGFEYDGTDFWYLPNESKVWAGGDAGLIYKVDPDTGSRTVGPLLEGPHAIQALALFEGTLYGIDANCYYSGGAPTNQLLVTINPVAGTATTIGGLPSGLVTLAGTP